MIYGEIYKYLFNELKKFKFLNSEFEKTQNEQKLAIRNDI